MKNPAAERVTNIIAPHVEGMGYDLVLVRLMDTHRSRMLQIFAEPANGRVMTLEDCERISRTLSAVLDVEDPIASEYTLEVSSPGIDRPLVRLRDYQRFVGQEAKVELNFPVNGRKRFTGTIVRVEDNNDVIFRTTDKKEHVLPFEQISEGQLKLTDALIEAHLKSQLEAQAAFEVAAAMNDNQPETKK